MIMRISRKHKRYARNARKTFNIIYAITIGLIKLLRDISFYTRRIAYNFFVLRKIGYNLEEVLDMVYTISPRQFEVLMGELFKYNGYSDVRVTKYVHDYGRDIILKRKVNEKIETTYVECKHYASNNVIGRDICFKLLGSMQMFNADKGIVCSTGKFHKNSFEVANHVDNLILMDVIDIEKMILNLKPEQITKVVVKVKNAC